MNLGRSSTRDHCSYALPMGAFTTMECRAAFISTAAGSIVCVELLGGEPSIQVLRKNPAPSVGEVKERHVEHEHGVMPAHTSSKHLAQAPPRRTLVKFCFHFDILFASNPRHTRAASPRSGGRIFQCSTRESRLHLFRGRKQKWRASGELLDFLLSAGGYLHRRSICYEAGCRDHGVPSAI